MIFATHNEKAISIDGTCLKGYVSADINRLYATFGKPMPGDGYKTDVEWVIEFADGLVATIYNWKNGPAYLGPDANLKYITEWNIGGYDPVVVKRIKEYLES